MQTIGRRKFLQLSLAFSNVSMSACGGGADSGMQVALAPVPAPAPPPAPAPGPAQRTYSTAFDLTENPISEGGVWVRGGATGLPWTNPRTAGGLCYGTQAGNANADDSVAHLTGFSANHDVTITLRKTANSFQFQEVEALLRATITANGFTCYEVNVEQGGQYIQIWQSLGGYAPGQPTPYVKQLESKTVASIGTTVADGSILRARIVGNIINVWLNGILIDWTNGADVNVQAFATSNGHEYLSIGQPGIGFYTHNQPQTNDFCATDFLAKDA
jgi:hypothetical protein